MTSARCKGRSRGVSKVSRNWSDHLWLVFACISLLMSMLPYSYTFMCWKPVIKVSRSTLDMSYVFSDQEVVLFDFDNECYGDLEAPGKRPQPSLSKHCPVKKDRQIQHMVMSQWSLMNGNGYLVADGVMQVPTKGKWHFFSKAEFSLLKSCPLLQMWLLPAQGRVRAKWQSGYARL